MTRPLLRTERLVKRFGGLLATDNVSIDVRPGEIHALIGPNGAGKTTLVHQLTGVVAPDSGTIHFAGQDITRLPTHARVRLGLGRSFQITSVLREFTALENVALAVQAPCRPFLPLPRRRAPRRDACAAPARACSKRSASAAAPTSLAAAAQPRRAAPARDRHGAGAAIPTCCCSTSRWPAWAPRRAQRLIGFLRALKQKHAMLLIEHDMDAVFPLADRITVLVYGRAIASGTPDEIRANAEVRQAYLGEEAA